ncbi:MAG: hypothetical protein AAFQ92_19175 [Bacteroidota bacterium]
MSIREEIDQMVRQVLDEHQDKIIELIHGKGRTDTEKALMLHYQLEKYQAVHLIARLFAKGLIKLGPQIQHHGYSYYSLIKTD